MINIIKWSIRVELDGYKVIKIVKKHLTGLSDIYRIYRYLEANTHNIISPELLDTLNQFSNALLNFFEFIAKFF
jgi:hypothetical protein